MNTATTPQIGSIFKENGYQISHNPTSSTIRKNNVSGIVGFVLSMMIGIILLTLGLRIGLHFTTIIAGFVFIGVPILFDRWRYPNKIIIDRENNELKLISGVTYIQRFRLSDVTGLNVDESILTSDTSPFKEGYQDFVYSFDLKVAASKIRLVKFFYRKENADTVSQIFDYLNDELKLKEAS